MKNSKNKAKVISVKVITNSKNPRIESSGDGFKVWVSEKPLEGKANEAVINLLADYFHVGRTSVRIVRGKKSKEKVLEIAS